MRGILGTFAKMLMSSPSDLLSLVCGKVVCGHWVLLTSIGVCVCVCVLCVLFVGGKAFPLKIGLWPVTKMPHTTIVLVTFFFFFDHAAWHGDLSSPTRG